MELRTNELFKSYLQETVISKTPSPEPQVTKFRDNLRQSESNTINKSISNLCTMMENCQIQLQTSNEIISKLVSPESDFVVIQKTLLKEFLEEFKQEFHEFKNEIKTSLSIGYHQKESKLVKSSQENIFSQEITDQPVISSQKSIFSNKPLTPPPSFEAMLKNNEYDTFSGRLEIVQQSKRDIEKIAVPTTSKIITKETPVIPFKMEQKNMVLHRKKKRQKLSPQAFVPLKGTTTAARMRNTQSWLDSLPIPPKKELSKPSLNKLLASSISYKKMKSRGGHNDIDSDDESLGKWSCATARTSFSRPGRRKRGSNFVKVDRAVRSEIGWGQLDDKLGLERNYRSEY